MCNTLPIRTSKKKNVTLHLHKVSVGAHLSSSGWLFQVLRGWWAKSSPVSDFIDLQQQNRFYLKTECLQQSQCSKINVFLVEFL